MREIGSGIIPSIVKSLAIKTSLLVLGVYFSSKVFGVQVSILQAIISLAALIWES